MLTKMKKRGSFRYFKRRGGVIYIERGEGGDVKRERERGGGDNSDGLRN